MQLTSRLVARSAAALALAGLASSGASIAAADTGEPAGEAPVTTQSGTGLPDVYVIAAADASPGSTAAAPSCRGGFICAFSESGYSGHGIGLRHSAVHSSWNWSQSESACASSGNSGATWKNCASSVGNTSGGTVSFFTNTNSQGYHFEVSTGYGRSSLGAFNNELESSFRW